MSCEEIELADVVAVDRIQEMEEGTVSPPQLPPRGSGHKRRAIQRDMERRLESLNAPDEREFIIRQPMPTHFHNINEHPWDQPVYCQRAKIVCLLFICILLALVIAFAAHCVKGVDKRLPNMVNIKKGCLFMITCVPDEPLSLRSSSELTEANA